MVRKSNLLRHKRGNQCKSFSCMICQLNVPFIERVKHKRTHNQHPNRETATTTRELPDLPPFEIDDAYSEIYTTFAKYIKSHIKESEFLTVFNFQLKEIVAVSIVGFFRKVFHCQTNTFKVSISFSYILRNIETNELAFYWSSQNNQLLFKSPKLVRNEHDFKVLCELIQSVDLKRHVAYPNTKYVFVKATNITFYVTKLSGIAIGAPTNLPEYLLRNKGLVSLIKSKKTGKPFNDKLCFFRSLALFRGFHLRALENETKRLMKEYCERVGIEVSNFNGISLDQLEDASKIFDIGINVYNQEEDRSTELIFRTIKQDNILYLNLYQDHFSYIKEFNLYSSSYCCPKCRKIFNRHYDFRRHLTSCDAGTKQLYSNGIFRLPETIFEHLKLHGINIPLDLRFYGYRICFDVECFMNRETTIPDTDRVTYTFKHELASISICSNVPGFTEPKCLISDGSPSELVKTAISYMADISKTATLLQKEKFATYIPEIDDLDDVGTKAKFYEYISQIPVLSFNGGKYDLRVMKDHLIPVLVEQEKMRFVIKRGSSYSCIATENLKFLDITNYLAVGINYDSFLKAYDAVVCKTYFPYEYFDSLDKLSSKDFPSFDDFYSVLKRKNTLEPSKTENLSEYESNIIDRTPTKNEPLTEGEITVIAANRYIDLRTLFYDNRWTFRDFLIYYNNR